MEQKNKLKIGNEYSINAIDTIFIAFEDNDKEWIYNYNDQTLIDREILTIYYNENESVYIFVLTGHTDTTSIYKLVYHN